MPAGSTVTVGRSKLQIDCGGGYSVDADWYFPTEDAPPAGLIYFQHGSMARAGFYNVTAAELAERTHSIVVAPTISSNLFACDSCQLGGDPMHYAVAKLFSGDRAALTASASAAAGHDVVLPQRYVIAGHSEGGQLAAGAAGYAAQIAAVNGTPLDLAGVLLLDTSEVGGAVSRGIAKIPADIPALYITEDRACSTTSARWTRCSRRPARAVQRCPAGRRHAFGRDTDHRTPSSRSGSTCSPASRVRRTSQRCSCSPTAGSTTCSRAPCTTTGRADRHLRRPRVAHRDPHRHGHRRAPTCCPPRFHTPRFHRSDHQGGRRRLRRSQLRDVRRSGRVDRRVDEQRAADLPGSPPVRPPSH